MERVTLDDGLPLRAESRDIVERAEPVPFQPEVEKIRAVFSGFVDHCNII